MNHLTVLTTCRRILGSSWTFLFFAIAFGVGAMLLWLVVPLLVRVLFDTVSPFRDFSLLNAVIAAIAVTVCLSFLLGAASDFLRIFVEQEAAVGLTERLFHAIQRLPLSVHREKGPADLLVRITDDVVRAVEFAVGALPTLLIEGGRLAAIVAISWALDAGFALLVLASLPLLFLEARLFAGRLAGAERESVDAGFDLFARAEERLSHIETIKALGQERSEALSFGQLLRRRSRVAIRVHLLGVVRVFTSSTAQKLWGLFLLWYLGSQAVRGTLTIGEVVALMLYLGQLCGPASACIARVARWKEGLLSMRRLDDLLERPPERDDRAGTQALLVGHGAVAASHLSFSFAPGEEVLHDVDVAFAPQSVTAIVGEADGGKAALVGLLMRFFDPTRGAILIDGQDISEVRLRRLREKVGIIQQGAMLFDGTVMDNILYGNEGLERGDAMRAARLAGAHDFIEHLPGGYDAPVGRGGELLSAGQRQRIAIARVLLRDPAIVVFDEAASALDAESEFCIQEVIASLRRTKTVIAIARRLSTIKSADTILVLEGGRFVEAGGFEELLEKRGAFSRFYWRQFGGLAAFRQQLLLELERSARYGSAFCLATLTLKSSADIRASGGALAADAFVEGVDALLKKTMRVGDGSAILGHDTILILLPEIDARHLRQFFERMQRVLPREAGGELPRALAAHELCFFGVRIAKKRFKTPEELLHALRRASEAVSESQGVVVVDEEALAEQQGAREQR